MRILPLALASLSILICHALSQDAPPVDPKAVLADLKQIKEKQAVDSKAGRGKIIQQLSAAASGGGSAIEFYVEAVQATQFMGQNHELTQFQDWKKKEKDRLRSRGFQEAVRLHLSYLVLTLQRASGAEVKSLIPTLINYAKQVSADMGELYDEDLMKNDLGESIFVRWFQIAPLLTELKEWETVPGNVEGIYTKTILPELRRQKDPRVIEYWDERIQIEANAAQQSQRTFNAEAFEQTGRPSLLWHRAEDELAIGQRNRAITDMLAIIKKYPAHTERDRWIAKLETLIAGSGSQQTPTE